MDTVNDTRKPLSASTPDEKFHVVDEASVDSDITEFRISRVMDADDEELRWICACEGTTIEVEAAKAVDSAIRALEYFGIDEDAAAARCHAHFVSELEKLKGGAR